LEAPRRSRPPSGRGYAALETLSGNWAMPYLIQERGVSARGASFALTAFWAMVTVGRVLIAVIARRRASG